MVILWCCYHQILGPRRHLPKFANGCYRHSDIWVRLDRHLTWQAAKSYVERGNALGLYCIRVPSLLVQVLSVRLRREWMREATHEARFLNEDVSTSMGLIGREIARG